MCFETEPSDDFQLISPASSSIPALCLERWIKKTKNKDHKKTQHKPKSSTLMPPPFKGAAELQGFFTLLTAPHFSDGRFWKRFTCSQLGCRLVLQPALPRCWNPHSPDGDWFSFIWSFPQPVYSRWEGNSSIFGLASPPWPICTFKVKMTGISVIVWPNECGDITA